MKNLFRALRMALNYRWSLIGATLASMLIALTWGSNLAAVYPFVEVIFAKKTLPTWVQEQEQEFEKELRQLDNQIVASRSRPSNRGENDKEVRRLHKERLGVARKLSALKFAAPWIESYAPRTPFGSLAALMLFTLGMTLVRCVLLGTNMVLVTRVSQGVVFRLQNMLFRKLLSSDLSTLERHGTGTLASRIHYETLHVGSTVNTLFGRMMREPLKLLTCLIGAAAVNWRLLVLSLLVCPAAMFVLLKISKAIKETTQKALEDSAGLMNQLVESLSYVKAVKAHNMQAATRSDVRQTTSKLYMQQIRIAWFDALLRGNNEVLGTGVVCLSFFVGGYLVLGGHTHVFGVRMAAEPMTFSTLLLFYGLLLGTTDPLRKLGGIHMNVRLGSLAADRIFAHIDQPKAIVDPPQPQRIPQHPRPIRFQEVTFGYRPDQTVLDSIKLEIRPQEKVAIVGVNGSGKSTMIDLLPRFYDPRSGQIFIDDVPITQYTIRALRRYITIVSQQTALFDDTVFRNIAYGCGKVSEDAVRRAAEQANALSFIEELPSKFQTPIGEHGRRLSGGQRQRLSLARAILRDSPVVILDEATSQIDQESEHLIHNALKPFLANRTALLITHRNSTLELADRVVVMESGRIAPGDDVGTQKNAA